MKKLKKNIASSILRAINSAFAGADTPSEAEIVSMLEYPPDETMGDLAFPCFKLSRALRKAPPVIAAEVAKAFECDGVEKCEVAGGYLNFRISNSYYAALAPRIIAEGSEYGRSHVGDGKTVVLDYSAPNICKPFHIGHLASTVIGHSLKMITWATGERSSANKFLRTSCGAIRKQSSAAELTSLCAFTSSSTPKPKTTTV